jgi:hypothetical protein
MQPLWQELQRKATMNTDLIKCPVTSGTCDSLSHVMEPNIAPPQFVFSGNTANPQSQSGRFSFCKQLPARSVLWRSASTYTVYAICAERFWLQCPRGVSRTIRPIVRAYARVIKSHAPLQYIVRPLPIHCSSGCCRRPPVGWACKGTRRMPACLASWLPAAVQDCHVKKDRHWLCG